MRLELPDEIIRRCEMNEIDLRIALAVQLYGDNRIDHSDACRLAQLSPSAFNREILSRAVGVQQYPRIVLRRDAV